MSAYAVRFLAIALIAGILGFEAGTGPAATIAKAIFLVFLGLFIFSLLLDRKPSR